MWNSTRKALAVLSFHAAAFALLGGCKDDAATGTTGAAATAEATATASAAVATAAPTPTTTAAAADTAAPTPNGSAGATDTTAAPKTGGTIDACCSALSKIRTSGRDAATKTKAESAATMCSRIAPLVKAGTTARSAALTQIKSSLGGVTIPAECN